MTQTDTKITKTESEKAPKIEAEVVKPEAVEAPAVEKKITEDYIGIINAVFPGLKKSSLALFSCAAHEESYKAGENLIQSGEEGNSLYILNTGQLGVFIGTKTHEEMVRVIHPYEYFGEMALLGTETIRSATIRAMSDCMVLVVDRDSFQEVVEQDPTLLRAMTTQVIHNMRTSDRALIQKLQMQNSALETAYKDLAQQEEMRREFVTTLSHELRTPLTAIQGFLQLVQQGMIPAEAVPKAMQSVTHNVHRMVSLTNNLLVLYEMQLSNPTFEEITIAEVLLGAVRKMENSAKTALPEILIELAPDLPPLVGDVQGLITALHALIDNAVKFSPIGYPVHVRARATEGFFNIDVQDHGIGIPADDHQRIFSPFVRLEQKDAHKGADGQLYEGMGVGLSIAQFIVARHKGQMEVKSEPGRGSTFTMQIPTDGV